jgi:hypothetical protein
LKFNWESNLPRPAGTTVFWAIEMILPVPGCTETMAAPHLSGLAPRGGVHLLLGRGLGVRVQGGGDGEAAAVDQALALN